MATLDDLLSALDETDAPTTTTSVRQSTALRRALTVAVELGLAPTANEATNEALRTTLELFARQRALEEHFERHPEARPHLHEVAYGLAVIDDSPLQQRRDLLERAEPELLRHRPDASAEDVYVWALSLLDREQSSASA